MNEKFIINAEAVAPKGVNYASSGKTLIVEAVANTTINENTKIIADEFENIIYRVLENSTLTVYEIRNDVHDSNRNLQLTVDLAPNATFNHIIIDVVSTNDEYTVKLQGDVATSATYNMFMANLNQGKVNITQKIDLNGEYATANPYIITLGTKKDKMKFDNSVIHNAKFTDANIQCMGVAMDTSHITFDTTGKIERGYNGSNAVQKNKGLVVGEKAKIDANPILLIDEYDVAASHSAGIGKINDEELYYLMSRGLTSSQAYFLIIHGYFKHVLNKIEDENIVEKFNDKLIAILEKL